MNKIDIMKEGGSIMSCLLDVEFKNIIKSGINGKVLDDFAHDFILSKGAQPILLGYKYENMIYNHTICLSVNDEVVHGLPLKSKIIKDGDILSIDLCLKYKEWCLDAARTYCVGNVKDDYIKLIDVCKQSLNSAISVINSNSYVGDISYAIQNNVESNGFDVVKRYGGHGIGKTIHEYPDVPNFGFRGFGTKLFKNMTLAVEPIVVFKNCDDVFVADDGWTVKTSNKSYSAHFEDTIAVTNDGCIVLTRNNV